MRGLSAPLVGGPMRGESKDDGASSTNGGSEATEVPEEASLGLRPLLPEAEMLRQEALAAARRRGALGLGSAATDGIGLCFSGGGVRAASFDCGIIWRLAELGTSLKMF